MADKVWALTLRQPWAFCIVHGTKRIENRSWRPPAWHEAIWIHAGARTGWDKGAEDDPLVLAAIRAYRDSLSRVLTSGLKVRDLISFSAVQGRARLAGVHHADSCGCACSPWASPGQWHWELADVVALARPVTCSGHERLWRLPEDVEATAQARAVAARSTSQDS